MAGAGQMRCSEKVGLGGLCFWLYGCNGGEVKGEIAHNGFFLFHL